MPGPNWLSQAELDDLRAQQIDLISEIGGVGDIKRATYTADGRGGSTTSFVTQSSVPMRIWISSGPNGTAEETKFWGEQELSQTDAFITLAWNADIQIQDWVRFDNKDWRIVGLQITDTLRTAIRGRMESIR